MLDIFIQIIVLSAAIFIGSAGYDMWRQRNR